MKLFSCAIVFVFLISFFNHVEAQDIKTLSKLFSTKQYNDVIKLGLDNLEKYPNNPELNMIVGRAYVANNQLNKAVSFLEKGTTSINNKDWVQAWCFVDLSKCYYFIGDYKKAEESLYSCIALNATENSTETAKKMIEYLQLSEFYKKWNIIESENIRFHFQNEKNINDIDNFIKNREVAFNNINKFFNAKLNKKIDFFVWDDTKQATKKLGKNLGFPVADICLINSRNNQTRGHEITHILLSYGIVPSNQTKFINEGIAVYFDQTNNDRFKVAKESIKEKEINIIDLWENPEKYPTDYNYTIAAAFVSYLIEKGTEEQMKELLKDQRLISAQTIYKDFDRLVNDFNMKLKE